MTIPAFDAAETPHSAFAFPASDHSFLRASGATCGPAPNTAPRQSSDGLVLLQARRLVLLREAARLRNLRRSKEASTCEAELRRVTNEILNTRRRTDA